ncbi:MAG TPA: hypothetical protein VGN17_08760 [Bryobacteraceae bacterium]|jgi:hypothetical protein
MGRVDSGLPPKTGSSVKMDKNYADHWRRYKRLRMIFFLILLGFPAWFFAAKTIAETFAPPGLADRILFVSSVVWLAVLVIASVQFSSWRCPSCGESGVGFKHDDAYP